MFQLSVTNFVYPNYQQIDSYNIIVSNVSFDIMLYSAICGTVQTGENIFVRALF